MKKPTKTIKQTITLDAQPMEVYDALLKARKHAAFTGAKATCSARIGGRFTAYDGYIFGKILELEEGKKIIQEWQTTEWPPDAPPSVVEFIIEKKGDGAKLKMVHTNVPAEQAEDYRQGWIDYYWNPMKQFFQKR